MCANALLFLGLIMFTLLPFLHNEAGLGVLMIFPQSLDKCYIATRFRPSRYSTVVTQCHDYISYIYLQALSPLRHAASRSRKSCKSLE